MTPTSSTTQRALFRVLSYFYAMLTIFFSLLLSMAFLLTDREEVVGYIVMGRVNSLEQNEFGLWHKDIVADLFTVSSHRRRGNMRFLLLTTLKRMRHTLETVWFQEPISEEGEKFLNKMSKETGIDYRTC